MNVDGRLGVLGALTHLVEEGLLGLPPKAAHQLLRSVESLKLHIRTRDLNHLETAIASSRRVIDLIAQGDPNKALPLLSLGLAYSLRFERLGESIDLENSISVHKQALKLLQEHHPLRGAALNNLGIAFQHHFKCTGKIEDLDQSISMKQEAANCTRNDDPEKPERLNNLGISLLRRFEALGIVTEIDKAIDVQQQTVALIPSHHPNRSLLLDNLGISFQTRFTVTGELSDIEYAIAVQQDAITYSTVDNIHKATHYSNLGNSFLRHFEHLHKLADLDAAIKAHQSSVDLTPDDHRTKPGFLYSLGMCYSILFEKSKNPRYIDQAMNAQTKAIKLLPEGHTDEATFLSGLAASKFRRYNQLKNISDLDDGISMQKQAALLLPEGHAHRSIFYHNLGNFYATHFLALLLPQDIINAISSYKTAVMDESSSPSVRFQAASTWASFCGYSPSALDAYKAVLELIPQRAWLGQKINRRLEELKEIGAVVNDAAAVAFSFGKLDQALEWLEEGRNIVWQQILQLRTPFEQLHINHPQLANKFQLISRSLEVSGASASSQSSDPTFRPSLEEQARSHRALATEYKRLLKEIRKQSGFTNFLMPKPSSELIQVSKHGLLVMINVHDSRCDAMVIHSYDASQPIIHVPLQDFSQGKAENLYKRMNRVLRMHNVRDSRKIYQVQNDPSETEGIQSILADIWFWVVHPIIARIEPLVTDNMQDHMLHLTWCATGALAFLPLHAAGIYGTDDDVNISDFVVSSYISTLSSLLPSLTEKGHLRTPNKILIVSQPNTPHHQPLPGTVREAKVIQKHFSMTNVKHLDNEHGSVTAVLAGMSQYNWVHLACHGIQNATNPLKSALALHDGRLELETLMQKSLDNAELAFLSACQTATGDEKLPDEAVHLAAGMQAAGFPSVIATMWSINDDDAPAVANAFYSYLFEKGREKDGQLSSAYALHESVRKLREAVGEKNFIRWIPFIHVGI
ncbi:hypothetical protein M422DRAFT_183448 [Sphaerobolus stellatus SS14]|uniref:CHAT domain-containing protein n=1 Tax=Sphaerobolus stellatus (strain SS14) TaxID=990650 RepID=A0A0C9V7F0_SPHS4|nr:hypothetical protein M422DRAFT_183448 [Sphaerobolus stellatus SS14]